MAYNVIEGKTECESVKNRLVLQQKMVETSDKQEIESFQHHGSRSRKRNSYNSPAKGSLQLNI